MAGRLQRSVLISRISRIGIYRVGLDKVQNTQTALAALLLQATMELRSYLPKKGHNERTDNAETVRKVAEKLKDCLILTGATNPQLNQLRRDTYKPSFPAHLKRICEDPKQLFSS